MTKSKDNFCTQPCLDATLLLLIIVRITVFTIKSETVTLNFIYGSNNTISILGKQKTG